MEWLSAVLNRVRPVPSLQIRWRNQYSTYVCSRFALTTHKLGIIFSVKYILKVPNGVLKLYAAICSVGQQAVDSLAHFYIEHKLKSALSHHNLAHIVNLLESTVTERLLFSVRITEHFVVDAIFTTHSPLTEDEINKRKADAFSAINGCIPKIVTRILGEDFKLGFNNLLNILQNPLHNKQVMVQAVVFGSIKYSFILLQLMYNLVDIVLAQMYPHLNSSEEN